MLIEEKIKNFKNLFDLELKDFFSLAVSEAEKKFPLAKEMTQVLGNYILQSGKRIRPALIYHTYLAFGGKSADRRRKTALKATMAFELAHTFLIIHDDVMDRDNLRRGNPTIHYFYQTRDKGKFSREEDAVHYGHSQAICIGDMAYAMVNRIISNLDFEDSIKIKLLNKIGDIIFDTTTGQFSDVFFAAENNISEKDVLNILEYKTAKYTAEGPVCLGGIMAGVQEETLKSLSAFTVPLGIAYQVADDILGVFGDSAKTGKPVGSDIREGKKTLLIVKALEFGNTEQKKEIRSALGNQKATPEQIEQARKIIRETGSLKYSEDLADKLSREAYQALDKGILDSSGKIFFKEVADFVIKRKY